MNGKRIGSLFSGIGGLELGLEWAGVGHAIWQVEKDEFCRAVLAKHWPDATRFPDVRSAGAATLAPVDLICGGFPCQDVSAAGKGAGLAGERSGLWREFARIVGELRPEWVVVENVHSGASRWLDAVVRDLGKLGYACLPVPLSAEDVGAPHRRRRLFIVASNTDAKRQRREEMCSPVGNPDSVRQLQPQGGEQDLRRRTSDPSWWAAEPDLGGGSDGFPFWIYRCVGWGLSYDESIRRAEVLRDMWNSYVSKALWRAAGGLERISQAEVLFSFVCKYEAGAHQARLLMEGQEASEEFLRELRVIAESRGASRRSEHKKQRSREHTNAMQPVSQLLARDSEAHWSTNSWEDATPRCARNIISRSHRLRALGNAVVPQCAEVIGWIIRELES